MIVRRRVCLRLRPDPDLGIALTATSAAARGSALTKSDQRKLPHVNANA